MSERLEQWKAREKIRSDIGWVAVFVGIAGAIVLVAGILDAFGGDFLRARWFGVELQAPWRASAGCVLGSALLVCAFGLWNVKTWARWAAVVLFASVIVHGLVSALALFAMVYLLMPAAARHFARARER